MPKHYNKVSSVKASSALAAPTPIANDNTELKLFSHVTGDNVEVEWELIEDEFVQVNLDENGSTTYESSDVVMNTSNNANTLGSTDDSSSFRVLLARDIEV
jgi:hypothetical protein